MALEPAKRAVATVDLLLSALSLLKAGALIFGMVLLEWSRKRETLARNEADLAKADLTAEKKRQEIETRSASKTPDQVIADFLRK